MENKVKWVWKSNKWILVLAGYLLLIFALPIILNKFGILSDGSMHLPTLLVFLGSCIVFARKDRDPKWYRSWVSVVSSVLLMWLGAGAFYGILKEFTVASKFAPLIAYTLCSTLLLFDSMRHSTIFVQEKEVQK